MTKEEKENIEDVEVKETTKASSKKVSKKADVSSVAFTPEQMEVITQMLEGRKTSERGEEGNFSVYDSRDPKSIETAMVSNVEGDWVVGFKDMNTNPYKKGAVYTFPKSDASRRFVNEPAIVLLTTADGKKVEEREMFLIDYMNIREKIPCKVLSISKEDIITKHGKLGQGTGEFAYDVDGEGKPVKGALEAESKRSKMKFIVELPGVDKPVEFIEEFLA